MNVFTDKFIAALHRLDRWFDEYPSYEGMTDDQIKEVMRKEVLAQKQYEDQQYYRLPRLRREVKSELGIE